MNSATLQAPNAACPDAGKCAECPSNTRAMRIEPRRPFDVEQIRKDFPILQRRVHGHALVYLDSAATTQKPRCVIDAITSYYTNYNANVHRGIHTLAEEATAAYEATRRKMAAFLGGTRVEQIIFTRNTTESLNLAASSLGGKILKPGDEILLTQMEHHSNLVPWFLIAKRTGAVIRHIPITPEGHLNLESLDLLLSERTKIVSMVHVSNVLGTINPVSEIAARAKKFGAYVIVDAAQSAPHIPLRVEQLGADLVAFSAHKMLGPTGVGVLWGRLNVLEFMDPYMGGGEMIREVRLDGATWNDLPWKFEAGTPNIADVTAFSAALDYLTQVGMEQIHEHEVEITDYALKKFEELGYATIYGPRKANERGGVIAFNIEGIHPHDLSTLLDHHGVAIRAGHHCAQPLARILNVVSTARASFYLYATKAEIDALIHAIREARKYFGYPY